MVRDDGSRLTPPNRLSQQMERGPPPSSDYGLSPTNSRPPPLLQIKDTSRDIIPRLQQWVPYPPH